MTKRLQMKRSPWILKERCSKSKLRYPEMIASARKCARKIHVEMVSKYAFG
jgi:hypothetical protein